MTSDNNPAFTTPDVDSHVFRLQTHNDVVQYCAEDKRNELKKAGAGLAALVGSATVFATDVLAINPPQTDTDVAYLVALGLVGLGGACVTAVKGYDALQNYREERRARKHRDMYLANAKELAR